MDGREDASTRPCHASQCLALPSQPDGSSAVVIAPGFASGASLVLLISAGDKWEAFTISRKEPVKAHGSELLCNTYLLRLDDAYAIGQHAMGDSWDIRYHAQVRVSKQDTSTWQ
jgi:hypothetical protein